MAFAPSEYIELGTIGYSENHGWNVHVCGSVVTVVDELVLFVPEIWVVVNEVIVVTVGKSQVSNSPVHIESKDELGKTQVPSAIDVIIDEWDSGVFRPEESRA